LTPKEEKELEWYFEEWLECPFSDTTIAERAAASIKKYGENLFNQVFTDRNAYSEYQQLRRGHNPLEIEIVGKTPEFQALHWEALWEPGFPRPLAVDCVMVRKSIKRGAKQADVPQSPVINLLVVTARPNEEQDVGYTHLFDNKEITEAIRLGRLELFHDKKRKAYFNQEIDLEDWLLPVVYSNQAVKLNLREFTPQEEEQFWQTEGERYRFTPPEYGFFGRDLEILKIEKSLLRHNILLLQGMGGTGKSTLLRYLRQWWQRTGFAKDVFYFGYDEKAWNLEQIIWEMRKSGNRV
jgi:hypothetical protein